MRRAAFRSSAVCDRVSGAQKTALPRKGVVERFAKLREALDKNEFIDALDAAGVLVRLDERGGDDEPAPWAFHGSGLPLPVEVPSSESDEVFLDRSPSAAAPGAPPPDASTVTGPAFSLSIPPARGRATVFVLEKKPEIVIGRDPLCEVRIDERSISRQHTRILLVQPDLPVAGPGGRARPNVLVSDLASSNGTRVNGRTIAPDDRQVMLSGDVLDVGDVALLFLDVAGFYEGLPRLCSG
jgi:FHA domain